MPFTQTRFRTVLQASVIMVTLVVAMTLPFSPASATGSRALSWTPPTLTNPVNIDLTNANKRLTLDSTKDYMIRMVEPIVNPGGVTLIGGRNVVLIGGQVIAPSRVIYPNWEDRRGLYLKNQTGTVHVEGIRFSGEMSDAIDLDQRQNATVQIQNIQVDQLYGSYAGDHADVIQAWGGPRTLRVDGIQAQSEYQGLFLLPHQQYQAAVVENWDLRNVDIVGTTPSGYLLWKEPNHNIATTNVNVRRMNNTTTSLMWPNNASWPTALRGVAADPSALAGAMPGMGYISPGYASGSWSPPPPPPPTTAPAPIPTAVKATSGSSSAKGYWLAAADGGIFSFGDAQFYGSTGGMVLNQDIVGMAATSSSKGYWLVARDGGIFSFGDAQFHGSTGSLKLNQPVVAMAPTPSGKGYWLVARDGGIFAFGDAQFHGSTGSLKLNQPVVSMAPTPSGKGYWLVASDGGIFAFGDAQFHGSTGGIKLSQPVTAITTTPNGNGYWMVGRDGGIFAFGDASFHGSAVDKIRGDVTSMESTPTGKGYWINSSKGQVVALGDARNFGSLQTPPNKQVVASAAVR